MAIHTAKIAPPNSVVLVSDVSGGEMPKTMGGLLVSATKTCVAVGCKSEDDGQTQFTLAPFAEVSRVDEPVYEGIILTPGRLLVIRSVLGQRLLELPVLRESTKVRIWVNDGSEPDNVVISAD